MRRRTFSPFTSLLHCTLGKRTLLWFLMVVVCSASTAAAPNLKASAVQTLNSTMWVCSALPNRPTTQHLNDIKMVSDTVGWAVGENNTLLKWDGTAWTQVAISTTRNLSLSGIDMFSADSGWMVGWDSEGSVLLNWNGSDWVPSETTETDIELLNVRVLPPNNGWAVGRRYGESTDSFMRLEGSSWVTVTNPTVPRSRWLKGISIVNTSDVWVVGGPGQILHWDGSGWATFASPTLLRTLGDIDMVSATDGWIVGDLGLIFRFDGSQWNVFPTPYIRNLMLSIRMTSSTDGWAVGTFGEVLHWDGSSWTIIPTGVFATLTAVDATLPDSKWVVGENGTIVRCQLTNLDFAGYLPIVSSNAAIPTWNGMTDQNLEVSFDFINGDTQWSNFHMQVRVEGEYPGCHSVAAYEFPGPKDIVNNEFSAEWIGTKGGGFIFNGHLTSSSTVTGTYEIRSGSFSTDRCGNPSSKRSSGTWSASR